MSVTTIFLIFFHISNLMAFLAFLLRDQLQLRLLMAVSLFLQGLYYYSVPGGPLFDPLFWKIVSFIANVAMIVLLFGGKIDFGIPEDMRSLFHKVAVLTPGHFRRLLAGSKRTKASHTPILFEGQHPQELHFLLRGQAEIAKGTSRHLIGPDIFLGEIAFITGSAASATVRLLDGAECVTWDSVKLKSLMGRDKAIDIALRGLFNSDLATKVAGSVPLTPEQHDGTRPVPMAT